MQVRHLRKFLYRTVLALASVPANRTALVIIIQANLRGTWGRVTYLEVDDDEDNEHSCEETGEIGRVLSVEGIL